MLPSPFPPSESWLHFRFINPQLQNFGFHPHAALHVRLPRYQPSLLPPRARRLFAAPITLSPECENVRPRGRENISQTNVSRENISQNDPYAGRAEKGRERKPRKQKRAAGGAEEGAGGGRGLGRNRPGALSVSRHAPGCRPSARSILRWWGRSRVARREGR